MGLRRGLFDWEKEESWEDFLAFGGVHFQKWGD